MLNLTLLNDEQQPTFVRGGKSSFIDLTLVSNGLTKDSNCWHVMESCTLSDHLAIRWNIGKQQRCGSKAPRGKKFTGWKVNAFDANALHACIAKGCSEGTTAEEKVDDVMKKVVIARDASMPHRRNGNPHTPVYW